MIIYKQLNTKNDFLNHISKGGLEIKNNFVVDAEQIAENSCSFNDTYKAFRINDQSNSLKGCFAVRLGYVLPGDVVEMEAEVYNISGQGCTFAGDIFSNDAYTTLKTSTLQYATPTSEGFQKVKVKMTVENDGWFESNVGVYTGAVGDYYIRNLLIKLETKRSSFEGSKKTTRAYKIKGSERGFVVDSTFGSDTATVERQDHGGGITSLKITHSVPFSVDLRTIALASNTGVRLPQYQIIPHGEYRQFLSVSIYDTVNNVLVDPNTIATNTNFVMAVLVISEDINQP